MVPMSFQGSNSSAASQGGTTLGGFTFSPKSSVIPPAAWIAIAAVVVVYLMRKR